MAINYDQNPYFKISDALSASVRIIEDTQIRKVKNIQRPCVLELKIKAFRIQDRHKTNLFLAREFYISYLLRYG